MHGDTLHPDDIDTVCGSDSDRIESRRHRTGPHLRSLLQVDQRGLAPHIRVSCEPARGHPFRDCINDEMSFHAFLVKAIILINLWCIRNSIRSYRRIAHPPLSCRSSPAESYATCQVLRFVYATRRARKSKSWLMIPSLLGSAHFALPRRCLMFKFIVRNFALAFTLAALSVSTIHAQATSAPPAVPAVTGGDPEPTSPNVVQTILVLLHLA
jgi:hypothetical protein